MIADSQSSSDLKPSIYNYAYNAQVSYPGELYNTGSGVSSGEYTLVEESAPIIGSVGWAFRHVGGGIGLINPKVSSSASSAKVNQINFRGGSVRLYSVPIGSGGGGSRLDSIKVFDSAIITEASGSFGSRCAQCK